MTDVLDTTGEMDTANGPSLVVITGLSGAGKSTAMRTFDDLGYYCMDNLPPGLIKDLYTLYVKGAPGTKGVVVASDVRSGALFDEFHAVVRALEEDQINFKLVFLDCAADVLVNRYKEVRRSHPLEPEFTIEEAIANERQRLSPIRKLASSVIDTSRIDAKVLRQTILREVVGVEESRVTSLRFMSFGFKYGPPVDADYLFDVRFLPNPYYLAELKPLTGEDDPVYDYVMDDPKADAFFEHITALLDLAIESFVDVGKFSVTVAIGCTGGRHRSVAFTRRLSDHYASLDRTVTRNHRDVGNPV